MLTHTLGSRSCLPDETVVGYNEIEAQGSRDRSQFTKEEERGPHQVRLPNLTTSISLPFLTPKPRRFREITRRIDEAKRKMGRVMQIAAFSLAEVSYAVGGDIGYQVQESARSARFRLRTKQDNVSGVLLPAFESYLTEGNNDFGLTGLGKGGQQVQRCRETYARAVETLVELASLQTAFVILDEVIKVVNRRGKHSSRLSDDE